MKTSLNDFDPDVREIADALSSADFSAQSQQRAPLRARLMEQVAMPQSPHVAFRPQPRGRLYAIMGTLAASLLLGIIVMIQSRESAPLTETIIPITPVAAPTEIPIEDLPRFYDTLDYATAAAQKPLFAPSPIPEKYSFSFAALTSPTLSVRAMISIYVDETAWQKSVLKGSSDKFHMDYLYIAQELANGETHAPQWNFPLDYAREESTFYTIAPQGDNASYTYGTAKAGPYRILIWLKDGYTFHLASSVMSYEDLQQIAESLQPVSSNNVFAPGESGSCDASGPGETPTSNWTLPIQKEAYTFERGFYNGHTGVDLVAVKDTPVYAANSGKVVFAGWSEWGYGNTIVISHGNVMTLYAQLNTINVVCNEIVEAGQEIGVVGSTGNSSGPHLHFEMRQVGEGLIPINPEDMLDF